MDKFDRFTPRETLTTLGLSNMGEFYRLRIKLGADDFPKSVSGTFDKAAILKLKNRLDNQRATAQPPAPSPPGRKLPASRPH